MSPACSALLSLEKMAVRCLDCCTKKRQCDEVAVQRGVKKALDKKNLSDGWQATSTALRDGQRVNSGGLSV